MLKFSEVGLRKICCGFPPGDKCSRANFNFSLGWVPYVCCCDTVIKVDSYEQLEFHIKSVALDPRLAERFCPYFNLKKMCCTHEGSRIVY